MAHHHHSPTITITKVVTYLWSQVRFTPIGHDGGAHRYEIADDDVAPVGLVEVAIVKKDTELSSIVTITRVDDTVDLTGIKVTVRPSRVDQGALC